MADTEKVCKHHGPLTESQLYKWSDRSRCRACRIEHADTVRKNFTEFVNKASDTDIVHNCKHHGSLMKHQLSPRRKECRECVYIKSTKWQNNNPDKVKIYQINSKKNPNFKNNASSSRLKSKYGISLKIYTEMFDKQKGLCAICHKPEKDRDRRTNKIKLLAVDHDHSTGQVRQLLCHAHNLMLGNAQDSEDMLEAGKQYLRRHKTAQ